MKTFINDICNEVGIAIQEAMCDWATDASVEYAVKSGKVLVSIDHNDNMDVRVIHSNGVVREHENIKNAILANTPCWYDMREAFIN